MDLSLQYADSVIQLEGSLFGRRDIAWGSPAHIGSAAFWIEQTRQSHFPPSFRIGTTLEEEITACLLGGHGITGEMTVAAFEAVRRSGLLDGSTCEASDVEDILRQPLTVPSYANPIRYRFPVQRSRRLAAALVTLREQPPPASLMPRELRDWCLRLSGVGPKTASWIARNLTGTDDVAIIDIHVFRAGSVSGIFDRSWRLTHEYELLEDAFCAWARHGGVPTAHLDICIWHQLSAAARWGLRLDASLR